MSDSRKVVIAGYVRSPFTPAKKGGLADVRADDIAAQTVQGLVKKTGVDPALIDDLRLGVAMPEGEQGLNMARHVVFLAGLPDQVPAAVVNRFCASSMQAVADAAGAIAFGSADCIIAAGVESMSHVPMGGFNPMPNPDLYASKRGAYMDMGETAENVADRFSVSRADQDAFALSSQFKTAAAKKAGWFEGEIVPIVKKDGTIVNEDGCPRPESTLEGLAKLKPAFKSDGSVTPGTASPLTDGCAALLICSEEFALKHKLNIMVEIVSTAVVGLDPEIMGMGPVPAVEKLLGRAGLTMKDIATVEMNEAFASQSVASARKLGIDPATLNKKGGAISLGHPLGATGARITGEAARITHEEGGKYAVSTLCIGAGQGQATLMKRYEPKP